MKTSVSVIILLMFVNLAISEGWGKGGYGGDPGGTRIYKVNRRVRDFPHRTDLSTPEAAYATITRLLIKGDPGAWNQVRSSRSKRRRPVMGGMSKYTAAAAKKALDRRIVEVHVFENRRAWVIARVFNKRPIRDIYDVRALEREGDEWLNLGDSGFETIKRARTRIALACAELTPKPPVPKIEDPQAYLKPFVDFLKNNAEEPKTFVLKALAEHKMVIMGEIHHRPRYWAFNSSLVSDPDFPKLVGTIYLELPSNGQKLVDQFLEAEEYDATPVIKVLRDMLWMGWPDQPMLDFFKTVWQANRNLEPRQRIRIVPADMQRPWQKIHKPSDWGQYERVRRDEGMADRIIRDIRKNRNDRRNALFIAGVGHAPLNLQSNRAASMQKAGWHLCKKLGSKRVYAIFPHGCKITNHGQVEGRLRLGLFESAFAALDNKPMAFPLDTGPFGREPFDAFPDQPVRSNYQDGFSAYLYLGPIEDEIYSPLIAGFYTDEFVEELDRRHLVMFDKGLAEAYGFSRLDAESFIDWMSESWGKPRRWAADLGPIDAWKGGDDWEKPVKQARHELALENPEVISTAATRLFDAIRNADYDRHRDGSGWQKFPGGNVEYQVYRDAPGWVRWVCRNFKENPIDSVELSEVFKDKANRPAVRYKLKLRDGSLLEGTLPFTYRPRQQDWMGMRGLDWHLKLERQ